MISRQLFALLLASALGAAASQAWYSPAPAISNETFVGTIPPATETQAASPAPLPPLPKPQDLFASQLPPAPPPAPVIVAPPPPPEPPRAPPLPYQYLGLMEDNGVIHIYLKKGENTLVTHIGEKLEETYLVKKLDSNGVRLVYLPLEHEHLLSFSRQ